MNILLTGRQGYTSRTLRAELTRLGHRVRTSDEAAQAVPDDNGVCALFSAATPDVIIHDLPYTDATRAETEPEVCMQRNAEGTLALARGAAEVSARDKSFRQDAPIESACAEIRAIVQRMLDEVNSVE